MPKLLYLLSLLFFIGNIGYSQTNSGVKIEGKKVDIPKEKLEAIMAERKGKLKDSLSRVTDYLNQKIKIPKGDSIERLLIERTKDSIKTFTQNKLPNSNRYLRQKEKVDSLKQWIENDQLSKLSSFSPTLDSLLSSKKIISERIIRDFYDSLGIDNIPISGKKQEVSEEELISQINQKFFAIPAEENKFEDINDDFSNKYLSPEFASQLPMLAAQQLPSEYLEKIDSIKSINLKEQRIALKEKHLSNNQVVLNLKEKGRFWDKAYLEGIIGISKLEEKILQLTPAVGFHLFDDFSIGMGPIIQFYEEKKSSYKSSLGLRQFIKQEFFRQKGYLQVEYIINPQVKKLESLEVDRHSFLIGGGVIIPSSGQFAMNIGLLYNLNDPVEEVQNSSPWVFRVGISSNSNSKK